MNYQFNQKHLWAGDLMKVDDMIFLESIRRKFSHPKQSQRYRYSLIMQNIVMYENLKINIIKKKEELEKIKKLTSEFIT